MKVDVARDWFRSALPRLILARLYLQMGLTPIQEIAYHKTTIAPPTHNSRRLTLTKSTRNLSFVLVKRRKVAHVRKLVLSMSRIDLLLRDGIPPLVDSNAVKPVECRNDYVPESEHSKRSAEASRVASCAVRWCLVNFSADSRASLAM
jgi:hypothetical protein